MTSEVMVATATATARAAQEDRAAAPSVRSPWLPCLLAWVFPGAGHVVIGRVVPGLVFAAVVLTTFSVGVMVKGTVYGMDPEQPLSYLATAANLGAGPLDLWARTKTFDRLQYRIPDSKVDPLGREQTFKGLRRRFVSRTHSYGRTFLLTAGLMNLLLILDVFDYCIGRKGQPPAPDAAASPAGGETPP